MTIQQRLQALIARQRQRLADLPDSLRTIGARSRQGFRRVGGGGLVGTLRGIQWRAPRLPALPGGLRPWVTLASLGFVLAALTSHGRQLLQVGLDRQGLLWLVLGVGLSLLSVVINGIAWTTVLRWLGQRPRWESSVTFFMTTNLRKFLPGGIWHLAARLQGLVKGDAGISAPLPTAQALLAVVLEPLVAACAALALMIVGGWQGGLGLLATLAPVLLHPRWLPGLEAALERRKARELARGSSGELGPELLADAPTPLQPGSYPWLPLLSQMAFVLLRFAGFACCVWAFDLQLSLDWSTWLAAFALAWTVGLVVPGAPGGLGVFETVLLLRLGGVLAAPSLLAVALSYRLVATLADLLAALLAELDGRLAAGGASGGAGS